MRRLAIALFVSGILVLAACGGGGPTGSTGSGGNTITMGVTSFSGSTNISVKAGDSVVFDDPSSSGGTHDLVTGTNGQFAAASGAPSEFSSSSGIMFSPGTSKTIVFATAGTFNITCTIHPTMQAVITVS
jgi:plastocyanin